MICRTLDEIRAAAQADHDGPMTQNVADDVAAILQPHQQDPRAA